MLDLGAVVAGAHAGGILANFGADVIKVEPVTGDPFRSDGALFLAYNRGKRGLGLDLKMPEGVALFHDLVRRSDVVLDNYRHGVRKKLGIDYAALSAINPRIISCSINAYGDKGDRAALPGFDPWAPSRERHDGRLRRAASMRPSSIPFRSTTPARPPWRRLASSRP